MNTWNINLTGKYIENILIMQVYEWQFCKRNVYVVSWINWIADVAIFLYK
jgi:hypothetical protein